MTAACMRELSCAGEVTKTGFILCAPLFLYAVTQGKARLPLILRTFMKRDSCWRPGRSRDLVKHGEGKRKASLIEGPVAEHQHLRQALFMPMNAK